ncbi:hypothetical protein [Nostoc sp.]
MSSIRAIALFTPQVNTASSSPTLAPHPRKDYKPDIETLRS